MLFIFKRLVMYVQVLQMRQQQQQYKQQHNRLQQQPQYTNYPLLTEAPQNAAMYICMP